MPEPDNLINFQSVGGVADGTTPNDSAFSSVLGTVAGDSAVIYFPAGTYYFNGPLTLQNYVIIRGAGSDSTVLLFNLSTQDDLVKVEGSATTDTVPIISDIFKDSSQVEVGSAGLLQAGDYIRILEDDSSLVISSSWALYSTGQIVQVASVSGTSILLASPLRRNFLVSRNVRLIRFFPIKEVGIESLAIERLDSTTQQTSNIYFEYAVNCRVTCVESNKANYAHIDVRYSSNIEVAGCYIHHAFDYGDGGKAYGVMLHFATSECLVKENIFDSLRHAMILQAGANGNVFAYNYSVNPYWTDVGALPANSAGDMVLHGNYAYANLFEGNTGQNIIIDNSHDINGMYNTFFRNRAELYGIVMNSGPASDSQNFLGNEITNSGPLMGNYLLAGTDHFEFGNNQLGTVLPVGTDNLPEASLFLDSMPSYYQGNSNWPPIGVPSSISTYTIEAEERYKSGTFTQCAPALSSPVPVISEDVADPSFNIYPVPVSDLVNVQLENSYGADISNIQVLSLTGQNIRTYGTSEPLDISALQDGLYFLRIGLSDGRYSTKKLVKYSGE